MSLRLTASDDELRKQFFALRTPEDVAKLLDVDFSHLKYHLYISRPSERYATFSISKKSGGVRQILAPVTALKIIQRKLNQVLQAVYQPKASVHGFVGSKSIVSNARMHSRPRFILNIDLKDFFPSINFGRVRGLLIVAPYNLDAKVATILAQICCFSNQLPQGAPTSPIISNMICAKMDTQLRRLAEKHRCIYTRYADDLTFSTSLASFPQDLAKIDPAGKARLGEALVQIIYKNGFRINDKKVRLQTRNGRQEVTGLTTNRRPNVQRRYVRQIRAMLHAWDKYGLDAAELEFRKYDKKHRGPHKHPPSFKHVVKGKTEFLGMVKGKDDPVYLGLRSKLWSLAPELVKPPMGKPTTAQAAEKVLVRTEGKTDWKHVKAAFRKFKQAGCYPGLEIEFSEYADDTPGGSRKLLRLCKDNSTIPQQGISVYIFDRDEPDLLKEICAEGQTYKNWGNGCFSVALPVPSHRQETPEISIELYYKDNEIRRRNAEGRRLYLNNEFHPESGRHKNESLNCMDPKKVRRSALCVIDGLVFNDKNENVALPKSDFADYVLAGLQDFDDFDFSEFKALFDLISMIVEEEQKK